MMATDLEFRIRRALLSAGDRIRVEVPPVEPLLVPRWQRRLPSRAVLLVGAGVAAALALVLLLVFGLGGPNGKRSDVRVISPATSLGTSTTTTLPIGSTTTVLSTTSAPTTTAIPPTTAVSVPSTVTAPTTSPNSLPGGTTGTTVPVVGSVAPCQPGDLSTNARTGPGLLMGDESEVVLMTNTGSSTCTIGGQPNVTFVHADTHTPIGVDISHDYRLLQAVTPAAFHSGTPAVTVRLSPGQTAAFYVGFNTHDAMTCYSNNDYAYLLISWPGAQAQLQFPGQQGYSIGAFCAGQSVGVSRIGREPSPLWDPPGSK